MGAEKMKPSEIIQALSKTSWGNTYYAMLVGPEDEPLYMLKPEVMRVLVWINKKILFVMCEKDCRLETIGVRIRIATGMLNKLADNHIITKGTSLEYHKRLIENSYGVFLDIIAEDLPF